MRHAMRTMRGRREKCVFKPASDRCPPTPENGPTFPLSPPFRTSDGEGPLCGWTESGGGGRNVPRLTPATLLLLLLRRRRRRSEPWHLLNQRQKRKGGEDGRTGKGGEVASGAATMTRKELELLFLSVW